MGNTNGSSIRVGRTMWDQQGIEWRVIRLNVVKGEAVLFDPSRKVTRTFHPVHDRGELEIIG